jgi:hypothetical protein
MWKQNKAAASSTAATGTNTPDQTTAANQIPQFVNETNNVNVTPPPSTPPPATTTTTTPPPSSTGTATVQNVVGERANQGIGELKTGAGKFTSSTSPVRNPKSEYVITGQSPAAGTQAAVGSHVTLTVKVLPAGTNISQTKLKS